MKTRRDGGPADNGGWPGLWAASGRAGELADCRPPFTASLCSTASPTFMLPNSWCATRRKVAHRPV